MMERYALIEDGVVTNVTRLNPEDIPDSFSSWVPCGNAGPGWTYVGGVFSPPEPVVAVPTKEQVNAERDRRVFLPFTFSGHLFDNDPKSKLRIAGAATLAGFAAGAGAQPGDLYWHGGTEPFAWITADNQVVTMDAQTVFAFGQTAATHETRVVFTAKHLKDNPEGIPPDFKEDKYWP